ncbi:phosphatidylserine decarboxylase [Rickettsiales bacterium Ac37b]|nr:phosphatidylserine decarboxylase [Rickettsiales bacterium Ac37b]
MNLLKIIFPPIHNDGYYFICLFAIVSIVIGYFSSTLGFIGAIVTVWCVFFFRDPVRITPIGDELVVSPADGIIQRIEMADTPKELNIGGNKRLRISIFLNVFNVHVNRVPATGKIKALYYYPGKFLNASLDKASEENERQLVLMETNNKELIFVQIAGLIARRIVCTLNEQQEVKAGERFGLIRFGSRMDVYLPEGVNPLVIEGQQVIAGETILADLVKELPARAGEIR